MEETKTAVEGEQPGSHQNEPEKEKTESRRNDSPRARKELSKAAEILGKRTSSKTPSPTSRGSRASIATKKVAQGEKRVTSSMSDEVNAPEIELMEEADPVSYKDSKKAINRNTGVSTDDNWTEWEDGIPSFSETERESEAANDLETLKRKAEKAGKKVAKLKKKLKKAKKNETKKSKLNALKDKLIKANAKLKRRMKKLEKAGE